MNNNSTIKVLQYTTTVYESFYKHKFIYTNLSFLIISPHSLLRPSLHNPGQHVRIQTGHFRTLSPQDPKQPAQLTKSCLARILLVRIPGKARAAPPTTNLMRLGQATLQTASFRPRMIAQLVLEGYMFAFCPFPSRNPSPMQSLRTHLCHQPVAIGSLNSPIPQPREDFLPSTVLRGKPRPAAQ